MYQRQRPVKVTNFGPDGIPIALGGWSTGVSSVNSNFNTADGGLSALNFVQAITANGSNFLMRPIVNFAAGSNTTVTVDMVGSSPSNTIRIHSTGGGSVSAGSNSTRVREVSTAGASTTLWSPFDHAHDGIGTITSSASNTMQRGTWNLRSGAGIFFAQTDTDGDGEFDTTTIGVGVAPLANGGTGASDAATARVNLDVSDGRWTEIVAANDQIVTNNGTPQNHSTLKFAALTGEVYHVELFLIYSGNDTTGDYRFTFALPTVTGWHRGINDSNTTDAVNATAGIRLAAATAFASAVQIGTDAADTPRTTFWEMMFRCGSNADVQFQFSNNSAAAGRTSTTRAGSILRYRKLA